MNITILYFSGTGNTEYVSNILNEELNNSGNISKYYDVSKIKSENLLGIMESSDILVVAYPIYGSCAPKNIINLIADLPKVLSMPLAVICTQAGFSGNGSSYLCNEFKKKGYIQKWGMQVRMPGNILAPAPKENQKEINEEKCLKPARDKMSALSKLIIEGVVKIEDKSFLHKVASLTQRPLFKYVGAPGIAKAMRCDKNLCIGCSLCAEECPNSVIEMKDNLPIFVNYKNCAVCLRCLNFCPTKAISFTKKNTKNVYKGPLA